jgi:glycosyltransferase involved in cell wall biosynthesis
LNILFLSHYFPPEVNAPASRTFDHCREWVRHGHKVTVVTCVPNHPKGEIYPGYRNRVFQREEHDGIQVIRLLTYLTANRGLLKRSLNYAFFMLMSVATSFFLPKCDVVVSTSPQFFAGLAGYFVSRIKRVPWVLEIRDLWPESILAVGAVPNRAIIRMLEGLEAFSYRKADVIVSVTDAFKPHIEARGGDGKVAVIKNGADLSLFSAAPRELSLARDLGLEGKFVAAYVGTHGMAHGLDVVLDAAQKLIDQPSIVFLLIGEGAEKQRLKARRDALGLRNVVMLDQQPKEMMPRIWSISDVSLVLLRKNDLFTTVIPSKIFESMAMAKPIVLGVEGESRDIVGGAGAGIGIEPENADELASAISTLASDHALYRRMARNGPGFVREHFDRKKLAWRYLALLRFIGMPHVQGEPRPAWVQPSMTQPKSSESN